MAIDTCTIMALRSALLQRSSALQQAAALPGITQAPASQGQGIDGFGQAMRDAVNRVSAMQQEAASMSAAYETGETTDIAAVMLSRQQASIGFEATLQVRNKLLSAYRDIMNMPV